MIDENLAGIYQDKLNKEANKGAILASFFWSAFDLEYNPDHIRIFNKLLKMFGKEIVFGAIIELYGMQELKLDNIYGILFYFCKKLFNSSSVKKYMIDTKMLEVKLNKYNKSNKKFIEEFKDEFGSGE